MRAVKTQNKMSSSFNFKRLLKAEKPRKVTPSVYHQQMLQSTEERLANTTEVHPPLILELLDMSSSSHHKECVVDIDQPLFQPFPSELVFQNFAASQTYELPLRLFNTDKFPRHMKLEPQQSEYFQVSGPDGGGSKVAPGLSASFTVTFSPQENKDYHHILVFVTERERFQVPVRAVGPRAILDFRDQLRFPACPVKASTQKTQHVRNVGNGRANFTLRTQSPFSVTPSCGTLDVGDWTQVTVDFTPTATGDHNQDLVLHYSTGEDVVIDLYGSCEELDLRLDPDSVSLEKTFISVENKQVVSLSNSSDFALRYSWSTSSNQEAEDGHVISRSPVLQTENRSVTTATSLTYDCIAIEPQEGEIWPNCSVQFSVVFRPEEEKLYQQTFYCDVTGRERRLPLTVKAEASGPKLHVDYNVMDMNNVFIGHGNCYQLVLSNKGPIEAAFNVSSGDSTFGRCFSFSPADGVVPSGTSLPVEVSFVSRTLGSFCEDVTLSVAGRNQPVTVTFRGRVIGPTFHFNVSELDFGDVSFGFPLTQIFSLFNTSLVPMSFSIRILGDGPGPPSVSCAQVSDLSGYSRRHGDDKNPHPRPREFTVNPAAGSVRAMSDVAIKVTLCSNSVKSYRLVLVVDVEGVGEEVETLPVTARCVVPEILIETPVLDFNRCFLNQFYEQQVQISNPCSLAACYGVLDQVDHTECDDPPPLLFGSPVSTGVILPRSSETFPVVVQAKAVGRLQRRLRVAVFGSDRPPQEVLLSCIGQGPIVHLHSEHVDFGKIPVLTDVVRKLQLSNHSPVPARFSARTRQRRSCWRVEPSDGEVPADGGLELHVIAHLKDTVRFQDRLDVDVQDAHTLTATLAAVGSGTTIVSDKPFAPSLDLGTHFSYESCQYHFKLTNHGQRIHRLYWGTKDNILPPVSTPKRKKVQTPPSLLSGGNKPVFSLRPSRVELFPGGSVDMVLTGSSDTSKVVRERLVCRGIVGHQGCYEHIMSVDVTCHFVAPVVSFSSKHINFYMEKLPGQSLTRQFEKVTLRNVSSLSLSVDLCVVEPFSLCDASEAGSSAATESMVLAAGKQTEIWICFSPLHCEDRVSQIIDEFLEVRYHDHPQQDSVKLHAEVHFPNLRFSSTDVDFGCVLNYKETRREITMRNCSVLPVSYHWSFMDEQRQRDDRLNKEAEEDEVSSTTTTTTMSSSSSPVVLSPTPSDDQQSGIKVEEVFDILPTRGRLEPGEDQQVTLSFYGHEHVSKEVVALCHVDEGPTYRVKLRGEASVIRYKLDFNDVDFGLMLFDHVAEAELTLTNMGKVSFRFSVIYPQTEEEEEATRKMKVQDEDQIRPGQLLVVPSTGDVDAGSERRLGLLFLPDGPDTFKKRLQLQVAFLPPQDITLRGEATFPRISLDLPRNIEDECYSDVVKRAKRSLEEKGVIESTTTTTTSTTREDGGKLTYEQQLHMEVDKALVKDNAVSVSVNSSERRDSDGSSRKSFKLNRLLLPEYVLDFGYVVPGKVLSRVVNVTNDGLVPVSFNANRKTLAGSGFSVEFERVKNLPCGKTQTFTVKFDPQGAKLQTGNVDVVMMIQVSGGPALPLRLSAVVTEPSVSVSADSLQFDTVQCSMCQIKTIQLFNHEPVPCSWRIFDDVKPFKKVDKFLPLHLRKKVLQDQRPPPVVFEMSPSSGSLSPGERVNVQIKFSPAEGKTYNRQLVVHMSESSRHVVIAARGEGEDPQLEFSPSLLELGPCLPLSAGAEAEVVVRNPCSFPVEFYSLEFDTQYLEEEKILRLMDDYDDNNTLLLPPRIPGESLPPELLDFYHQFCSENKDDESSQQDVNKKPEQLETTPVSRAVARHMSIDLSPEGRAALNRRGIAIIVYGAPLTGKSSTAAALARHYGAACLSIDGVVKDALMNGSSAASVALKQIYDAAAAEFTDKDAEPVGHVETSDPDSDPVPHQPTVEVSNQQQETETKDSLFLGGDENSLRNLFPDQLLVDVLAERFQSRACHRGVVVDGLDSSFSPSSVNCLQLVLKALNRRKHVYAVDLNDSYAALKERRRAQREADETRAKEETEREERRLEELDDDEYEALPEDQKLRITLRHREELRRHKLRELERKEREEKQEEMKRLRDEDVKKKNKKCDKKETKDVQRKKNNNNNSTDVGDVTSPSHKDKDSTIERDPQSHEAEHHGKEAEDSQKQEETKETKATCESESSPVGSKQDVEQSVLSELQRRFASYEQSRVHVDHILQHWDRVRGSLLVPFLREETPPAAEKQSPGGKKNKKTKTVSPMLSQTTASDADKDGDKASTPDVVPQIVVKVSHKDSSLVSDLINGGVLPPLDLVLDELGVGPSGPPVPPPVTFSIASFPPTREQSDARSCRRFIFLSPSAPEKTEEKDESDEDANASTLKEETAANKSRGKGGNVSAKDKKVQRSKSRAKVKTKERSKSPVQVSTEHEVDHGNLELKRNQSLTWFRWVVPAGGDVVLKIWFHSDSPGTFEHSFDFEVVGTRRRYQLTCRGNCSYPSICSRYTTLFALSKKAPQFEDGVQKTYVIEPGYFEFGPLLCSKTRDRYKENRYPENTEKLVIHNNSGLEAEVHFSFQHDAQATTFLLDPPTMTLKPDQRQELSVWAYPTKVGQMRDSVVCRVTDNPQPVVVDVSCRGVRPELELETKNVQFDRTVLHRQDSRCLMLHNKTWLPVSWRLQGVEELGDEISVPQDHGVVAANSSVPLSFYFRAKRQLHIKKMLRLEVSDVEKILGVVHTENIQVTAEAYDITLDISPDRCLDFGTVRVFEETKLPLMLKNQGKYEIVYKFLLKRSDPSQPNLDSIFTVSPKRGSLFPHDKSTTVHVVCSPNAEVVMKEQPVLVCQVIEPNIGNGGETIADLSINVSVQSVFSRYKITPPFDINFGPMVYGSRRSQSFTVENCGVFETRFSICSVSADPTPQDGKGPGKKVSSGKPTGPNKTRLDSTQKENVVQNRFFSVSPCSGTLPPGAQQLVTVDCVAEQLGSWNQGLLIDVSDRDPVDQPDGIPYRLLAEVCKPGILLDVASIFEEHRLCGDGRRLSSEPFSSAAGVYVQDEKRFVFNHVLVGRTATARLKLTNNSKVPCVLGFNVRHGSAKSSRTADVFDVEPSTLNISAQSFSFAVVSFSPQTMQTYRASFEATMEGASRMTPTFRSKVLEFELTGEGNLPSVCVVHPSLRNARGNPVVRFRRVLTGRRRTLPLVVMNNGNVPAQVQIFLSDQLGVFTIEAAAGNTCRVSSTQPEGASESGGRAEPRVRLRLDVNQQAALDVSFYSHELQQAEATLTLTVDDNRYGDATVHLTAETYREALTLDDVATATLHTEHDDHDAGNYEVMDFGDCHVGRPYRHNFTITNHSSNKVFRFQWPQTGRLVSFSPQVGHLHAGCSKQVTATFQSSSPVTLKDQTLMCQTSEVVFEDPVDQVMDWDDGLTTVQWTDRSKVVKAEPEPNCSVVNGSNNDIELHVSAVCDYVKFSCNHDNVTFKDTMIYQSRVHQLQIINLGNVKLEYSWKLLMDQTDESSRSLDLDLDLDLDSSDPFSIEPSCGSIEAGSFQDFRVRFSPVEVDQVERTLLCSVSNLREGDSAPRVSVSGRGLQPRCHFQIPDSDYVDDRCRSELRDVLDPDTRVVEVDAVGLSAPSVRRFAAVNTTTKTFSFKWKREDDDRRFQCLTASGNIEAGKKTEMCFEFVAEHLNVVESLWSLTIDDPPLTFPFLLVGNVREPLVYLSKPHLDLGEMVVGRKVTQFVDLVNDEQETFSFSVVMSSLLSDDQQSSLVVQPTSGSVSPADRLPLSVSFTPGRDGYVGFRPVVKVKSRSEPLTLNVRADCFSMSSSVQVENPDGGLRRVHAAAADVLDFGKVGIPERSTINIITSNLARSSLDVTFDLSGPSETLRYLEVKPRTATVHVGKRLKTAVCFCPVGSCSLHDVTLKIKVKHGATFVFSVRGRAVAPSLEFSFTKFNFGKCFVNRPMSETLRIRNNGEQDISIQCQFRNTSFLELNFQPGVLSPGVVMETPVVFCPRETRTYHEKLSFILNSCVTRPVEVVGQGVEMKLELEDPRHRTVKLGSLTLGQEVKKQVVVVNRSVLDVCFDLKMKTNSQLDLKDLVLSPSSDLTLKSNGGSCRVDVVFSPRQHAAPFKVQVQAECPGLTQPLMVLYGCCQGVEVHLDQDHVAFGAVVQHCEAKKTIVMMNTGDVGARFQWDTSSLPSSVSVRPSRGFISPGSEVPVDVTFCPDVLNVDSRFENLTCSVENGSSAVRLTVTGSCVAPQTCRDPVVFACPVRSSQSQTLPVSNPTNRRCCVRPVVDGDQWSAVPAVTLEPFQNRTVEITYRPLRMTPNGSKHQGSVFLTFPDGTGILYALLGTADPPKPEDHVVVELPAKRQHTQLLPVYNWLHKQQRFRVVMEILKPDKPDATVSVKGLEFIDVPASSSRDYQLRFYGYREGQYNVKVTFVNESSGEFLFHLVSFKTTPPSVLSSLHLSTSVRRASCAAVQVENPLDAAVVLSGECDSADVFCQPQYVAAARSATSLSFRFLPLRPGDSAARLTFAADELGSFVYDLTLRATPPPPEKTVRFKASLGSSHAVLVKFTNYSRFKTEYTCKTDRPDFSVDKSVRALPGFPDGSEASVEVCFEPLHVGAVRGELTLTSGLGGEYVVPLHGDAVAPRPQGPFSIKAGQSITIPFKNVFLQTTTFCFQVDDPGFTVRGAENTIMSKKTQNILVSFHVPPGGSGPGPGPGSQGPGSQGPWSGKLTISSQRSETHRTTCSWVYYLRGFRPESS